MKVYVINEYSALIVIKEIVRRTELCVFYPPDNWWPKGRKESIGNNSGQNIFFSWDEAYAEVLSKSERRLELCKRNTLLAKQALAEVRALVRPEEASE